MNKVITIDTAALRKLTLTTNPFLSLARAIIYQQISTKAGNSIYAKFLALFGRKKPSAKHFLQFSISDLKSAGISPQKAGYLKDLSDKLLDKTIDHKKFNTMTDQEVKEHLMRVKGIGSWTADMFLIFALGRVDILPLGDLAIQKGFQKAFGLKKIPTIAQMEKLAKPHKGNHTNLALHLWGIMDE